MCCVVLFVTHGRADQWRNYTAMNQTRAAIQHDDIIYVVTSGGMFTYSNDGDIIETLTTSEGLSGIDLTAIAGDQDGRIWIGASGGLLDGFDTNNRSWIRVRDIAQADFTQRDITTLVSRGDSLYVGTSFGVSVYSISRNEFNDSYIKFGDFPTQTPVTAIDYDQYYIWVATSRGVARGEIHDPLLAAPDRWRSFSTNDNLPTEYINDLILANGIPYAATDNGIAWYDGTTWNTIDDFIDREVRSLEYDGSTLFAATSRNVYRFNSGGIVSQYGPRVPDDIRSLTLTDGGIICLLNENGVAYLDTGEWVTITPPGPRSNVVTDISIDNNSTVWLATGHDGFGRGFYRFNPKAEDDERWHIYNSNTYPELLFNDYYRTFTAADGTTWISSWGRGIARITPEYDLIHYYRDEGLVGIITSPNFVVVGRAAEASDGAIWFSLYNNADRTPLTRLDPDTDEVTFYRNDRNTSATVLRDLIVDRFDTKWIISTVDGGAGQRGLFYFNEELSVGNNVNGWGIVTTTNGLPSNNINVLVEDNRGEIWIGTDAGLSTIANPQEPQATVRDIFVLQDQYINSIAVDPLNRKWIGTQEGVFLISADGTSLLEHYNVQNTANQLLANDVLSVAFDKSSGIAYFGTDRGLSSLVTVAVEPRAQFDELFIAPNPYRIPADHELKIDGLMRNSSLKILSVDGRLVRSFDSPGGRVAYWDGRDDAGRQVASGVYVVVGISEDGTEVGTSKVTVIRR